MKDSIKEFAELKEKIEKIRQAIDRDVGALDQLRKQVEKKHGISSDEDMEKLLAKTLKEGKDIADKLSKQTEKFEEEYVQQLEKLD